MASSFRFLGPDQCDHNGYFQGIIKKYKPEQFQSTDVTDTNTMHPKCFATDPDPTFHFDSAPDLGSSL